MERDITKSVVPILTVGSIIAVTATIIWCASSLFTRVDIIEKGQEVMQSSLRDVPTRQEYNALQSSIAEVKKAVEDLKAFLMKR